MYIQNWYVCLYFVTIPLYVWYNRIHQLRLSNQEVNIHFYILQNCYSNFYIREILTKVTHSFTTFCYIILNGARVTASLGIFTVNMLHFEMADCIVFQNNNIAYNSAVPPPRSRAHIITELLWSLKYPIIKYLEGGDHVDCLKVTVMMLDKAEESLI